MAEADPALKNAPRAEKTGPRTDAASTSSLPPIDERAERKGRSRRMALMFAVPALIIGAGTYFWVTGGRSVSTDNAYVKRDIVSVSADVNGRIVEVRVRENQMVKAGDLLFVIDPEPYKVALEQANAQIATAQVDIGKLEKDYQATSVDIKGSQDNLFFAQEDLKRQQALMKDGFTTLARLQQAEQGVANARRSLREAQADAASARAALATGPQVPGLNPQVAAAQAQRDQAALNLNRTAVRAPIGGRVSQADRLQIGQMAITGLPLVSIVASEKSWITANFKETDLDRMQVGQAATIKLDAYPGVKLKGHVESIGAGTGSQFSVLPAQNANGNWVKVTQRVPVRIAVDDTSDRTMIAGLSAHVTVDISGAGKPVSTDEAKTN